MVDFSYGFMEIAILRDREVLMSYSCTLIQSNQCHACSKMLCIYMIYHKHEWKQQLWIWMECFHEKHKCPLEQTSKKLHVYICKEALNWNIQQFSVDATESLICLVWIFKKCYDFKRYSISDLELKSFTLIHNIWLYSIETVLSN